MNTAITSLKNDINFARNYINDKNVTGIELDLKLKQIAELEKAIEILKLSERRTPTEANKEPDTKQLIIGDVSQQRDLLITAFTEADRTGYIELLTNAETIADKVIIGNL